jgi:hypothetical protein
MAQAPQIRTNKNTAANFRIAINPPGGENHRR